ncbi:MAG: YdiU family protein [Myxococcota bacterium]
MPVDPTSYRPDPRYLDLGVEGFADPVAPADFPERVLRFRNQRWAERVGLGALSPGEWLEHFARFAPLPHNLPEPLALRYHGHQFQAYNPQIGDGRGFLYAQLREPAVGGGPGRLLDLGTKGSGRTPHSRDGDGRLTLKGAVREILATEMLEALGVPTSKTFSVIETGEKLQRHDEPSPTRSAVLVRLSWSHIRFGTFQRHAFEKRTDRIGALVEHCLATYYPEVDVGDDAPLALFRALRPRMAELGARWMAAGFVHGVLNTDNMCVTGESFDYGPWRFLPRFDPTFTAAYFDQGGLYAYGRQIQTLGWNLARLAEALHPASPSAPWQETLEAFQGEAERALARAFLGRFGLEEADPETNASTTGAIFGFLTARRELPFQQLFHDWYGGELSAARAAESPYAALYEGRDYQAFRDALAKHTPKASVAATLASLPFQRARPVDVLIGEVEELWSRIDEVDDWSPLEWKVEDIRRLGAALRQPSGHTWPSSHVVDS